MATGLCASFSSAKVGTSATDHALNANSSRRDEAQVGAVITMRSGPRSALAASIWSRLRSASAGLNAGYKRPGSNLMSSIGMRGRPTSLDGLTPNQFAVRSIFEHNQNGFCL